MKEYRFTLHLTVDEFMAYYEGWAHAVVVKTWGGTRIQLPAFRFRPFINDQGVHGQFFLVLDDSNKFVSLQRIG